MIKLRRLCVLAVWGAMLSATPESTSAQEELSFNARQMRVGRPANFYETRLGRSKKLCQQALAALNEPAETPREYLFPIDLGAIDLSFFLKNKYSITWEPRVLVLETGEVRGQERRQSNQGIYDSTVLELFRDGKKVEVIRFFGFLSSIVRHHVSILPAPSRETSSDITSEVNGMRTVDGHRLMPWDRYELSFRRISISGQIDVELHFGETQKFRDRGTTFGEILSLGREAYTYRDLIEIEGHYYWLVMPARAQAFGHFYKNGVRVYVLRSKNLNDHELLCEFRARYREAL